jgi:ABC-type dipeptide/oligopeptide/nickel transport system permease subunit
MIISSDNWKRFRKNKTAVAGLVIIILSLFLAIFAYVIAPDNTENANRMIVEIGSRKPRFTQQFLKVPKAQNQDRSRLQEFLFGTEDRYQFIPVNSYSISGDQLVVMKYVDEGLEEPMEIPLEIFNGGFEKSKYIIRQKFLLGTDTFGRDILSRLIIGIRVSMAVGIITVIISLTIGIMLGALAGYYGGRTDAVITWFINVFWSIPTILLVFALTLLLGKGFWQIFIAIGLTMWVNVARLVRGQVLVVREMEYVEAARALGFRNGRIILRHILPNILGPVMVIAASNFASAIVIEAGLSFLGIGVQPPMPSWGLMIKENYNFIITQNAALALAPGIAIMILVLAFNLVGNGLRDALDVRS